MKKMTTDEFIAKSRAVHGDKYDYSKTEYVNQSTPVVIICPEHGEFLQRPNNHYLGAGCPVCSGNQKMTTKSFIERAIAVHGNVYDYTKSVYVNSKTKLIIICSSHGEFLQTPEKHLAGQGCPKCTVSRVEQTNLQKYGVRRPLQNPEIYDKVKQTNLQRYGVENPMQYKAVQEKLVATNMSLYGVPYSCMADDVIARKNETLLAKYGGLTPFSSADVREKSMMSIREHYHVDNAAQSCDVQNKIQATKRQNGTFCSSIPEDKMYEILCDLFGASDIERQYQSSEYPFNCDFYVKSQNLYVELNAMWTHGGHWFGTYDDDRSVLASWEERHTSFYNGAVFVWSESDVAKREAARVAGLSYLVFWKADLSDFYIWVDAGCPVGHDYETEYSWLPKRKLTYERPGCKLLPGNFSQIVKYYQQDVFYAREKALWNQNPEFRGMPLQLFLYINRQKYLGKILDELSDAELLRGFGISGVLRSYTAFHTVPMQHVIDVYNIKSVLDPCAGWGERMLCCHINQIPYQGYDVNLALQGGYDKLRADFNIQNCNIIFGDAARAVVSGTYDAVITCPPYFDTEIYSENGAENLSYDKFLDWWRQVVINFSNVTYFCFQINQKYKADMKAIVERNGFTYLESFVCQPGKVSHFNRKNGTVMKHEFEEMLVFKKG